MDKTKIHADANVDEIERGVKIFEEWELRHYPMRSEAYLPDVQELVRLLIGAMKLSHLGPPET